ncbi:MAG: NAD-binding protein [Planctomycetaceae bacterium]|nr:NAD-binding protein [Planctomycetaceae bacterium]
MSCVRWGILSTAKIGVEKVIPAMQQSACTEVVAIASRDADKAQQTAKQLGIARSHGSYEDLLADEQVDAIYNPLPNHLHVSWTIKALEAGKHVLCEKPIGLTSDEGQTLVSACQTFPQLKVMEAFMYRHHPQWQLAKSTVDDGKLGDLRTIQSFFSYFNTDAQNIRNQADIGGGGLMDIGCYNISLSRYIFGEEPRRVVGVVEHDPKFRTDRLASAILEFSKGTATFSCSTQLSPYQRVNLFGTQGRLEIDIPFNAPPDRPCRVWIQANGEIQEIELPTVDQYTIQGELMSAAILEDQPVPTPLTDAVQNMLVIEAIKTSAAENRWVSL